MLPFKLRPAFKDYLWGGTNLKTVFHKKTDLPIVAESWELSAHPDGDAVIDTGECAGLPFSQFVRENPQAVGDHCAGLAEFPILIKLIDAAKALSVQVHPADEYARRVEGGLGKTEMWVILDCEPDAFLYFGLERELPREELRRRIEDGTVTEVLHKAPVKKGDVFFIGAGTIHAIGAGILLAEIQQNSNTTYRMYDFGRLGADGKPRALHVEKALDVAALCPAPSGAPGADEAHRDGSCQRLAACPYFTVDRLLLKGEDSAGFSLACDGKSFISLLCIEGSAVLTAANGEPLPITKGESVFIPADHTGARLAGNGTVLITTY